VSKGDDLILLCGDEACQPEPMGAQATTGIPKC
jgi:hypothetical protein